jgi:hypothetical protein
MPGARENRQRHGGSGASSVILESVCSRCLALKCFSELILTSSTDFVALPESPERSDIARLSPDFPENIHYEIVYDLILVSLGLAGASDQADDGHGAMSRTSPTQPNYTPLARLLIFSVAELVSISPEHVSQAEKVIAQNLFFIFEQGAKSTELDERSRGAVEARTNSGKARRWAGIGAGFIAGGVAIGVTGGQGGAPTLWFARKTVAESFHSP